MKTDIKELEDACKMLGLNPKEFLDTEEVSKGLNNIDYETLYNQEKELNIKILKSLNNIPSFIEKSFSDKFSEENPKIEEIQKSIDSIKDEMEILKESPLHKRKSCDSMSVIEKSLNRNDAKQTFKLSEGNSLKTLKKYLGNKTLLCLNKGIDNSIYEKAALQLDAQKTLLPELRKALYNSDKINIID